MVLSRKVVDGLFWSGPPDREELPRIRLTVEFFCLSIWEETLGSDTGQDADSMPLVMHGNTSVFSQELMDVAGERSVGLYKVCCPATRINGRSQSREMKYEAVLN